MFGLYYKGGPTLRTPCPSPVMTCGPMLNLAMVRVWVNVAGHSPRFAPGSSVYNVSLFLKQKMKIMSVYIYIYIHTIFAFPKS